MHIFIQVVRRARVHVVIICSLFIRLFLLSSSYFSPTQKKTITILGFSYEKVQFPSCSTCIARMAGDENYSGKVAGEGDWPEF